MSDYSAWTTSQDGIRVPPLQPIPSDIVKPDDALCDICQTQNFIDLGKIIDVRNRPNCPFCRLALAAIGGSRVPNEKNGEPVNLEVSVMTNDEPGENRNTRSTRVLMPSASAGDQYVDEAAVFPQIVLVANDHPAAATSLIRPVCREKIDFTMVSNWIDICEALHGDECRKRPGMDDFPEHPATILSEFRLIDVELGCLVNGTSDCKYVALSYVWGRANVLLAGSNNIERLEKPGAFNTPEFRAQVPQTIKDAMQATRGIGIRYLWVDALCIIQDENYKEKLPHIKQMNRIYETAELVIVAMSSSDAGSGLPGVRPWTRDVDQHIEQITPQLRLGLRTSYGNDSVGRVYQTRGWTYQETCFARRQLIFTGGQVVFECKYASNWSEDRVVEDRSYVLHETENGGSSSWDGDDDIRSYEAPVQNYSDRTLSFPSDIYNAFAGVAQRIRDLLGTDLCHGIPPQYFDWCLLWDPLNKPTRRQGTPSWSWSGWEGGVFPRIWDWYNPKTRRIQNALKARTWIIWYQRAAHDSTECRLVWDSRPRDEKARDARNFYGGKVRTRFSMDCSRTQPTKRRVTGAASYYPDILCDTPGSGFLQFWTVSVQFQLDKSVSEAGHSWLRGHTVLGIFGSNKRELGTIAVADAWLAESPSLPLAREFILLCEGRDERPDDGEYDAEPGWKYKVMLLEWHGDYAERVAVGSINKGHELEGSPTWKEIILG
ncbi:HET-domain-containing protein [Xylaria bambusicola]|uniref:HET-domain-containing protein n=1 Tax=Xylaria bambusicola TaxID=326684 RepID=UPI0020083658|nr:HET-domain-containing protein [Xylaria bambusicola]KAI0514911.1 HET-domain-containing protein [Xylaria bambusicola]